VGAEDCQPGESSDDQNSDRTRDSMATLAGAGVLDDAGIRRDVA
jgi:hypothetical protein